MRAIKMDFTKDLDYEQIIGIQRKFEKEGSFLGSEQTSKVWRIIVDLNKSNMLQAGIRDGDILDKGLPVEETK